MMDLNKFTQKAQEAIFQSQQIAKDNHHQTIEPMHFCLHCCNSRKGLFRQLLTEYAGNTTALVDEVKK